MNHFCTRLFLRSADLVKVYNGKAVFALAALALARLRRNRHTELQSIVQYAICAPHTRLTRRSIARALTLCSEVLPDRTGQIELRRSIILKKAVSPRERGFLLVHFEQELEKLVCCEHFEEFERAYEIAFIPSWQPFFSTPLIRLAAQAKYPFWIMPSARCDDGLAPLLGPMCRVLPFHAASWIHPNLYQPAGKKDIDILMVANFSEYKRHWRLFEALPRLPSSIKVVIAGRPHGLRTSGALLQEARAFGAADRFTLYENPTDSELSNLLARARLFVGLSHKEGSYVAVAEALMADTAAGVLRNALIGTKEYINDQTGVLFDPHRPLAPQLLAFLSRSHTLSPARWAREHISAVTNCSQLNALVAQHHRQNTTPWSRGLEPFHCVNFTFFYTGGPQTEQHFTPVYEDLAKTFGIRVQRLPPYPALP